MFVTVWYNAGFDESELGGVTAPGRLHLSYKLVSSITQWELRALVALVWLRHTPTVPAATEAVVGELARAAIPIATASSSCAPRRRRAGCLVTRFDEAVREERRADPRSPHDLISARDVPAAAGPAPTGNLCAPARAAASFLS